jgi:hypothetical protein
MTHPFVKKDWTEFKYQTKKIDELLDTERQKLVDYAQSEAPKQGYMNRMNWLLGTIAKYKAATEDFLDAISTLNQLENSERSQREETTELRKQNSLLRKYITALGKNPNDVNWMNERDFRETRYQY